MPLIKVLNSEIILASQLVHVCVLISVDTSGLYYKTIMIVIMMIVSDATIWSITYGRN